jgi:hypothetical protein
MLILLDIDGVMVPAKSWKRPEFLYDDFFAFSNEATLALQQIITATNGSILLTSSHKSTYSIEEWGNIFRLRGISVNNIYSLPDNSLFLNRKDEIMNWVNSTKNIQDFIIIDDDKSLNDLPTFVKNRLIQPSSTIGLTQKLALEAFEIIEKERLLTV